MSTYNVRSYGAVPDWDTVTQTGTDNLLAFNKVIQTAANEYQNAEYPIKIIAEGHFYLSNTLHIPRGIILEGSGHGHSTHKPGTLLVFPENVTGIRIHSTIDRDIPPGLTVSVVGGALTQIRNLTVHCKNNRGEAPFKHKDAFAVPSNGYTGHGIHSSITCVIRDVTVSNFAENGIFITADGPHNPNHPQEPKYPGNAAGTHIINSSSNDNGAHGIYFLGVDANVGLIEMCFANVNWGNGFRDEGGVGNTYVACYCQGNQGERNTYTHKNANGDDRDPLGFSRDGRNHDFYVANHGSNQSVFYGCYSEASIDHIYAPAGAIGGILGQAGSFPPAPPEPAEGHPINDYFPTSNGFALSSGGVAGIGPLIADYKYDLDGPRVEIGDCTGNKRAITLIAKKAGVPIDYLWLLYQPTIREAFHDWWEWQCGSAYGPLMRFPTGNSHTPHLAPWMPNGLWIGRDYSPHKPIHMTAAPSPPVDQYTGAAQTYEKGDIIWNSEPSPGQAMGQVCIQSGTQSQLNQGVTLGSIEAGTTTLIVNTSEGLMIGQFITIAGISGIQKIVEIEDLTVTIEHPAGTTVMNAAIAFSPALFATFGEVMTPSTAYAVNQTLTVRDRSVTATMTGITLTLPAAPIDGQIHSIKAQRSVTVLVNTEGGMLSIDGQPSVSLSSGQTAVFRYSGATGEWEIRS